MTSIANPSFIVISVDIRNNETGVVRRTADTLLLDDGEQQPSLYIWEEGSYSCDCNRALLFARAAGEPEPDLTCSGGRYSVRISDPKTGRVLYQEFPEIAVEFAIQLDEQQARKLAAAIDSGWVEGKRFVSIPLPEGDDS